MADKVLRTVLSGRDELTSVLTKAAASTRAFEKTVEDANVRAAKSSTAAAQIHRAAAAGVVSATKEAHRAVAGMGADFEREGSRAGGLLAQGVRTGIMRNSPLIVAGISAALAAGAPLLTAGATTLFAGIGAVAAAQSEEVRSAWVGMWDQIVSSATADAAVLVPVFARMADQIGASFQRMRPLLQDAFEAIGPQIDTFTESLTRAAENALPGLVRAVQEGGPVIEGLGHFLEEVGSGLGEFFNILADHAPAAGQAFAAIGDIIGELLPVLGELLGQGAELASAVLPPLAAVLGVVADALSAIGPLLPGIVAAFSGLKIAQTLVPSMQKFGQSLAEASYSGGRFASTAGKMSSAVSTVGRALPGIGIAIGLVTTAMEDGEQQINAWAQALLDGGSAATEARAEMQEMATSSNDLASGFSGFASSFVPGFVAVDAAALATGQSINIVKERARELYEAMSPLEQRQQDVATATNELEQAVGDFGATSPQARAAAQDLAAASAALAAEQDNVARAMRGVTEAMAEQADQARSRVDSAFAYQDAVEGNSDAVARLAEAQANLAEVQSHLNDVDENTRTSQADVAAALEAVSDAATGVQRSYADMAYAAGQVATANLPAEFDEQQRAILGAKGELDELNRIISTGVTLPPELEQYRLQLEAITGQADGAMLAQAQLSAAIGELGFAVESVPGTKDIIITAPTEELRERLADLGFTVEDIPGTKDVRVSADTQQAMDNLGKLSGELTTIDDQHPEPDVSLNDNAFTQKYNSVQGNVARLNGERPTPVANLNSAPFISVHRGAMGMVASLDGQRPAPVLSAVDHATPTVNQVLARIALVQSRTVTITTNHVAVYRTVGSPMVASTVATGGAIEGDRVRRYDVGGAVTGPGGPTDDMIGAFGPAGILNFRLSNGEHVLDARDVNLLGGQQGVYAFRAALNAGMANAPTAMPGYSPAAGAWGGTGMQVVERNPQLTYIDQRPGGETMPKIAAAWREMEFLASA